MFKDSRHALVRYADIFYTMTQYHKITPKYINRNVIEIKFNLQYKVCEADPSHLCDNSIM